MVDTSDTDVKHMATREFVDRFGGDVVAAALALKEYAQQNLRVPTAPKATRTYGDVVVSTQDLAKTYKLGKQHVNALNGINLNIRQGEFVALTGASGSGKSTLLQLIGGLDKPTSGTVTVNQTDIGQLNDARLVTFRNQTIGFVFQFFYLQPFLDLATNIAVPGMFAGSARRERLGAIDTLLAQVGLTDRAKHLPKELSGGQMQRAAIARALLNRPKILLADEPTGNLDTTNGQAIIDLFEQIRDEHGTTVIMVTHDHAIAQRADREIRMQDGAVV